MSRASRPRRLTPLRREEWGDDVHAALSSAFSPATADRFFATGPDATPMPNVLATLMHHPALAGPFLTYNTVLLRAPALDHRLRELVVLRVAWRTRSSYEWLQHVRIGSTLDITTADLDAIADGDESYPWTSLEADALAATDQLLDHYCIDDDTWERLARQLDERQLVELLFVVGTYTGLAMALNSAGVELDRDLEPIAATTRLPGSKE